MPTRLSIHHIEGCELYVIFMHVESGIPVCVPLCLKPLGVFQKVRLVKTLLVNPEMRETLGFPFQKESELKLWVSYHAT